MNLKKETKARSHNIDSYFTELDPLCILLVSEVIKKTSIVIPPAWEAFKHQNTFRKAKIRNVHTIVDILFTKNATF